MKKVHFTLPNWIWVCIAIAGFILLGCVAFLLYLPVSIWNKLQSKPNPLQFKNGVTGWGSAW